MSPSSEKPGIAVTKPNRVVFPELDNARIRKAAGALESAGEIVAIPLGEAKPQHRECLVNNRGMKPEIAERMLRKPLILAAAMVATGEADALVAGVENPTKRVIEAASLAIGLSDGVSVPSSFFLMRFRDGTEKLFADCAVNVAPDAEALASIARASARSAEVIFGEARVALLSYSTGTSGAGPSVELVRGVAEETGFVGPIQADAALNSAIAETKGIAPIDANVLIFPTLDAGNIAYKLCQELAGAQAVGPMLQGFRKPVCDLSRGATVDDIIASTRLALSTVQ